MIAVSGALLLSFAALAIDIGYLYLTARELQRTCDASALGGASVLFRGIDYARSKASEVAAENLVARQALTAGLGVTIGNWNGITRTFTPGLSLGNGAPNAVHVTGDRTDLSLFFAPVMGINTADVGKEAIAAVGSGRCIGIWGIEGVTVDGDIITDSYISSRGAYATGNQFPNGDLCSCRDIIVNGGVQILGDAIYGEGYRFIPYGNSYTVYGVVDDQPIRPLSFEADFVWAAANNDNASIGLTSRGTDPFLGNPWNLYIDGTKTLTLSGGTYYFNSVTITGQGQVFVTGPTTIYLTGPGLFTGGGVMNVTQVPSNLKIFSNDPTLNLTGGSAFYGAVVAPDSDIILEGTTDFFGVLLGRTLDFDGNARVHVDETLVLDLFGVSSVAPALVK